MLKDGWCTVLFNCFLAGKIGTLRMKGGNTDEVYKQSENRLKFAKSLQEQHPDLVKIVWRYNRWHHEVNYSNFKQKLIKVDNYNELIQLYDNEHGMKLITL